jgi:peptidoglycan/xylan/chitin deacetylase (PgdA/CDA1 family)
MPLLPSYLIYPHRAYGMDQSRYDWRLPTDRPKPVWPDGAQVAAMIVVPIEHHPLDPIGKPFKHPGAMVTPYPDLRHYTSRDYGNRVGIFRILRCLQAAGIKATFPINANQLDRLSPLVDVILAGGHEIAAYGLSTNHIHWSGVDLEEERDWIGRVRDIFASHSLAPRTWLSPARHQSFGTLDLLKEFGFDICLDWEADSVPLPMRTAYGPVLAIPLSNELDDRSLLIDRRQSEAEWVEQVIEAVAYLKGEAPHSGGQMVGFTLTPYVTGQPFRIEALRRLLAALGGDRAVWTATAGEIAEVQPA